MRGRTLLLALTSTALASGGALAQTPRVQPAELPEVVVTAAPYPVSIQSTATSVDILTRADLDTAPPAGLGDMLAGLPGLRSSSYAPGSSRPIIRGLSGPRVLILQNGVGLVDASSLSPDHAVASEPGEASRIEVLRGPSTLAYGGSAIGGVVNVIDDRVPSRLAENGAEGRFAGSYGTVDNAASASVGVTAGSGPWVIALDAVKRHSDDYATPVHPVSDRLADAEGLTPAPGKLQLNTGVDLEAFGGGVSRVGEQGFLGFSVKRTTTEYGVPFAQVFAVGPPDPDAEGPVSIALAQTRLDVRGERRMALGPFDKARLSIGWADYEHREIAVDTGEVGTTFFSSGAEGRLELVQAERGGWQGAVGAQALSRTLRAVGDEAFIPSTRIREAGIFTLQRLDRGPWGLEAGLRLDQRRLDGRGFAARPASEPAESYGLDWAVAPATRSFTNVSAAAAVFVRPAEHWFASLSLSRNGRAPTEFELFADGPHPGTGAFEIGDPTLKSERVTSLEAALRYDGPRGRVEIRAFGSRYHGFIDEVRTGDVEDGLPVFRFGQTDADFVGLEVEASHPLWRGGRQALTLEGAYDWVRGETDRGTPPRIPPWSLTGRLVWEAPTLEGTLEVRHVAAQDRVAPLELPTGAYSLVNARLAWSPLEGRALKLFVEGRNLTDAEAREHASFLKDIAPMAGRSFRAGLAYSF